MEKRKKSEALLLRLTPEDRRLVDVRSAARKLNRTEYIRAAVIEEATRALEAVEAPHAG